MIHRPVAELRYFVRRGLERTPTVCDEAVRVANALNVDAGLIIGTRQEHRAATKEGFQVCFRISQRLPYSGGDGLFAAKIWEWCT